MSGEPFTRDDWLGVAVDLRGMASRWWEENEEAVLGLAKDELADVMLALRKGDTVEAKLAVAAHMDRETWAAYRDGTTSTLQGIAKRRAALFEALEDLGRRTAKIVAEAVLDVLGI